MLLKKQTVWLLTMLSLVVVLSVYYLTTPEKQPVNMAGTEEKEEKQQEAGVKKEDAKQPVAKKETKDGATVVTREAGDDAFEALRMELTDLRSKQKEELTAIVANTKLSAEEISDAKQKIEELNSVEEKETIIEKLVLTMDYDAALVRVNGKDVDITVKADKLSPSAANSIIQLVNKEFDSTHDVVVNFQPEK
ncbi:SpoIIIAH-like family protein [Peribacillus glennii]|uniref:SpoIIIAH-like family protein n=1 Tax=Peribacillus glennii TaxID=2303991 RepID=A0A372LH74_9BACI|nr:SpoIIIAH-like family protein [Peribacillus glennii]RFU65657.1 SpoIIIAH-like family protein [Peribacillus glennii]